MNTAPRKALITGAGRGIGKAIALELSGSGHHVCLLSRTESELKNVCAEIEARGGQASYLCFDLSDAAGYPGLKAQVESQLGRVDVLVHNAAPSYRPAKLTRMAPADWQKTLSVNLEALAQLCGQFLEPMREAGWGRVVSIGSLSGVLGAGSYPAYCAAKAGMEGLTKNLAIDYSRYGITINMVSPGFVETERFKQAAPPEMVEKFKQATAIKRLGQPEDVAHAVDFLASDKAAFITGINLLVCGGLNLGNLW
ncbi:MAG: SDR family oxidoreductase [Candidatus Sericytochromatia bacterium]|nr:SDR family oxidoreductase [Candidatus Sericytochromatia bacterium]